VTEPDEFTKNGIELVRRDYRFAVIGDDTGGKKPKDKAKDKIVVDSESSKVMTKLVEAFWEICKEGRIPGIGTRKAPKVIVQTLDTALGIYKTE
jgi:hypothetical protein